jgi:katanin p60 ATPase-containing subunit A1
MPMDISGILYERFEKACHEAEEAEGRGDLLKAGQAYHTAAKWMREYALGHKDASVRQTRLEKADAYEKRATLLEQKATEKKAVPTRPQTDGAEGEDNYEAQVTALIHKSSVRWEDIGGLEDTKRSIKLAYALALAQWPAGVESNERRNNILLYGPPGTGKTLLAAAAAGSLQATFFNVKVSNLLSKFFGESTKLVTALYAVARKMAPAVIFIDEFESLTPERGSGDSGAERRIVSTLLAELDGLATKDDENFVLTISATNLPWLLDTAILSRFKMRIYVPLPDEITRFYLRAF